MRFRYWFLLLLLVVTARSATATSVTATVTDLNTVAYANATVAADYVNPQGFTGVPRITATGATFTTHVTATADGSGAFAMTLTDDHTTAPSGGRWLFTICAVTNSVVTGCFQSLQDVTGASQSLTTALSAAAPVLPVLQDGAFRNITVTGTCTGPGCGGGAATAFGTVSNPVATIAATIKCQSYDWTGAAFSLLSPQYIDPRCYGLNNNGRYVIDASVTNGQSTVTCANNDCGFVAADVGKIVWMSNDAGTGGIQQVGKTVILPQGTISTVNGAQSITVSTTATTTCTANCVLVWASDDTIPLTNAWTAAAAGCSTVQLPGINQQGTGPALMLLQDTTFNTTGAGATTANCGKGAEGVRSGLGIVGVSPASSIIALTPSFNLAHATNGHSGHAMLFTTYDNITLMNFGVWGGGNSQPTGASSSIVLAEINSIAYDPVVNTFTGGNNTISNVTVTGYGAGATGGGSGGIGYCFLFDGGGSGSTIQNLIVDGCGARGVHAYAPLTFQNLQVYDNGDENMIVEPAGSGCSGVNCSVTSIGGHYCCTGGPNGACDISTNGSGALFRSIGDEIGINISNTNNMSAICAGYGNGISGSGTEVDLIGSNVIGSSTGATAFFNNTGNTVKLSNSIVKAVGSGNPHGLDNWGTLYDTCGNTVSGNGSGKGITSSGGSPVFYPCLNGSTVGYAQSVSGCSLSSAVGGVTTGKFASGTTGTCTVTITLPATLTGWTCDAHDLNTPTDVINQTASSTTGATIAGTTVSGDVITWKCSPF